jgi:hypothetical protein
MPPKKIQDADVEMMIRWRKDPREFIKDVWGLIPQRTADEVFIRGRHFTWQQDKILNAITLALANKAPKRISVRSGHGIGKSTILSWIVLWYLICFKESQIPCTAPTSEQMNDVLWKEIAKWLQKMPPALKKQYEWTNTHIRMTVSPATWFARARTARKESPEALAGMHGDNVMLLVDEASGVADEIYQVAEGALTSKNVLVLLISNPTRTDGYFYETHHKDKDAWQLLNFSSLDSPIVDIEYVQRIIQKYGDNTDEYRIRVLGEFPDAGAMDDGGYVPLLLTDDLHQTEDGTMTSTRVLGIDPGGEGSDASAWVLRDNFKAKVVAIEKISSPKSIAQKTLTLMDYYKVLPDNVFIDNFGVGANVAKEIALSQQHLSVQSRNVGEKAQDPSIYINSRAESYIRLKNWLRAGGELVNNKAWDELTTIKFRRELSGKMKIMSKREMRTRGIKSPNVADALMLTFLRKNIVENHYEPRPYVPNNNITGY